MDKMKSVLVVCLVLGLFLGQSRAEFQDCYVGCFVPCLVTGDNVIKCSLKCLKDCIGVPSHGLTDAEYFCKLGCASSLCINLGSNDDPGEKRVAHCVNSCSKTCANHV